MALGERYHPQTRTCAFVVTDDGAAMVGNGAADLHKGDSASGIAHGVNEEERM